MVWCRSVSWNASSDEAKARIPCYPPGVRPGALQVPFSKRNVSDDAGIQEIRCRGVYCFLGAFVKDHGGVVWAAEPPSCLGEHQRELEC